MLSTTRVSWSTLRCCWLRATKFRFTVQTAAALPAVVWSKLGGRDARTPVSPMAWRMASRPSAGPYMRVNMSSARSRVAASSISGIRPWVAKFPTEATGTPLQCRAQAGVNAQCAVEVDHIVFGEVDRRPGVVINAVRLRNDRVHGVVSTR